MEKKIWLDGIDYTNSVVSGLDSISIEHQLNSSNKSVLKSLSNTFVFSGAAYAYLKSKFVDASPEEAKLAKVAVKVNVGCCEGKEYDFIIHNDLIEFCPGECQISTSAIVENTNTQFFDVLTNKPFFSDYNGQSFTDGGTFPRVFYGTDNSTQIVIYSVLLIVFPFVFLAATVLTLIVNAINTIPGININLPNLPTFSNILDEMVGGSNFHSTVPLNFLFARNCTMAGGTFSSAILSSGTYSAAVLFSALNEGNDGNINNDPSFFDAESFPVWSTVQVLELIKPVFNADYRVQDVNGVPTLIFERVDFFETNNVVTICNMADEAKEGNALAPCYKPYTKTEPAYSRLTYGTDALDQEGNRMLSTGIANNQNKASFADYVEHNEINQYPTRKGANEVTFSFGAIRGQNDIKRRFIFDTIRQARGQEKMLVMERGTCSLSKILLLENLTNPLDAKMLTRQSASNSERLDYNAPLYLSANYEINELIQNFFFVSFPGYSNAPRWEISDWKWSPDSFCNIVNTIDQNGLNVLLTDGEYQGKPTEGITVDYENAQITFKKIILTKI